MKAVPETDFAVVVDTERKFIVDCGRYTAMNDMANHYNHIYQSSAYKVKRWLAGE